MPLYSSSINIFRPSRIPAGLVWDLAPYAREFHRLRPGEVLFDYSLSGTVGDIDRALGAITHLYFTADDKFERSSRDVLENNESFPYNLVLRWQHNEANYFTLTVSVTSFTVYQGAIFFGDGATVTPPDNDTYLLGCSFVSIEKPMGFDASLTLNNDSWDVAYNVQDEIPAVSFNVWGEFQSDTDALILDSDEGPSINQSATIQVRYDERIVPGHYARVDGVTYRILNISRTDRRRTMRLEVATQ